MDEEEVHIAVGKNFRKEKANILWAAANFPRATITLVNVHWPSKWMPFMGGKVLYKFADEKEKEMHRGRETESMIRMLSQYKGICDTREVRAHYLTHDDILDGLVNLVKKLKIKRIVIGSRNLSKQAVLRKCCQVLVVLNGKYVSTSNDHLKHTGSSGCGRSSELLASIHELSDESDGYTTPLSDFEDETMDEDGVIQMDSAAQLATEAEHSIEESNAYEEEVENKSEEDADQSDEIQSSRNITGEAAKLMEEMEKLQRKLKDLQDESHNHEENILSPRKMIDLLRERTLSKKRYPDLQIPDHIVQFSMAHIGKATNNFYSQNLIGEGGYGPVYKGKLGGKAVAIKLLRPHGKPHGRQGFPEFQQEVVVLGRIEHPHIVRLIGVCQESCVLVYEHLPNGTLMDGIAKGLPWRDRVRILAEQRSALAHLHSSRPHAIIHADLKLTNILLDTGNVSRLGDFGTARIVQMKPLEEDTICRRTNPMGTMGYMDPVFFMTGELTTESDVYAFGVVILQVLTGLLDLNIVEQVQEAIKMDAVHGLLDASAGSWPEVQAKQLLRIGLKCCSLERKQRPTITADADWRSLDILQTMRTASKSRKWSNGS
ncbi:U-box domain-containing protein 33 isoform X2 [Brachypodium distachyon]|uniref:U-box domain-containing protein 33 isoform X2 n=1 Tax=Brachypodium distachyon TaxID=15368 RepID=UPI00052FF053|nr:U-box domain-containing protein 33 isoform X2 [Brachypodium distachyon]|eukprot:XP_003576877.2 U-box domain-containing protein 33 isoform X2 [Brachypodium distachyon]